MERLLDGGRIGRGEDITPARPSGTALRAGTGSICFAISIQLSPRGRAAQLEMPRSRSPATLNVRSTQPSPRGFALSSKGHVRLALLAPSGVVVRAEGRRPAGR